MTNQNYNQLTSSHELVFINFYADWCRFSQILAPIFEEAYNKILKEFDPAKVLFAKVDCDSETDISGRFKISKYPTLKLVMNGKPLKKEFRGQRSVEAIYKHAKSLLEDPVHSVITRNDYQTIDEKKPALIAYSTGLPNSVPGMFLILRIICV